MQIVRIEDDKMHLRSIDGEVDIYVMECISSAKGIYKLRKEDEIEYKYIYKDYAHVDITQEEDVIKYRNLPIISEFLMQEVNKVLFGDHAQKVHIVQSRHGNPRLLMEYIDGLSNVTSQIRPRQFAEIDFKKEIKPEYQNANLPIQMTDGSIDNMMGIFIAFIVVLQLDPHFANLMYSTKDNKAKKVDNEQCLFWKFGEAKDFIKFFLHNLYFYCLSEKVLKSLSTWMLQKEFADTLYEVAQKVIDNEEEIKNGLQNAINTITENERLCAGLPIINGEIHLKYSFDKVLSDGNYLGEEQQIALNVDELYQVVRNNALYMQQWAEAICQYQGYKGYSKNNNNLEIAKIIDVLKAFDYRAFEDIDRLPLEIIQKKELARFCSQITKVEIIMLSGSLLLLAAGTAMMIAYDNLNMFIKEKIIAFEQEIVNKYVAQCIALLCFISSITLAAIVLIPEIKRVVDLNNEIDLLDRENSLITNLDRNNLLNMGEEYKLYLL